MSQANRRCQHVCQHYSSARSPFHFALFFFVAALMRGQLSTISIRQKYQVTNLRVKGVISWLARVNNCWIRLQNQSVALGSEAALAMAISRSTTYKHIQLRCGRLNISFKRCVSETFRDTCTCNPYCIPDLPSSWLWTLRPWDEVNDSQIISAFANDYSVTQWKLCYSTLIRVNNSWQIVKYKLAFDNEKTSAAVAMSSAALDMTPSVLECKGAQVAWTDGRLEHRIRLKDVRLITDHTELIQSTQPLIYIHNDLHTKHIYIHNDLHNK